MVAAVVTVWSVGRPGNINVKQYTIIGVGNSPHGTVSRNHTGEFIISLGQLLYNGLFLWGISHSRVRLDVEQPDATLNKNCLPIL